MAKFRDGGYNTLVATCVGEEGLDIGDVDLIICFDAHNSPVRWVGHDGIAPHHERLEGDNCDMQHEIFFVYCLSQLIRHQICHDTLLLGYTMYCMCEW